MINPALRLFGHSLIASRPHSAVLWLHGADCVSSWLPAYGMLLLLGDLIRSDQISGVIVAQRLKLMGGTMISNLALRMHGFTPSYGLPAAKHA